MSSVNEEEIKKRFGAKVKEVMSEQGHTITSLADIMGKDRQDIQQIVNGYRNPTLLTIVQLARGLKVPPPTLIDFKLD